MQAKGGTEGLDVLLFGGRRVIFWAESTLARVFVFQPLILILSHLMIPHDSSSLTTLHARAISKKKRKKSSFHNSATRIRFKISAVCTCARTWMYCTFVSTKTKQPQLSAFSNQNYHIISIILGRWVVNSSSLLRRGQQPGGRGGLLTSMFHLDLISSHPTPSHS